MHSYESKGFFERAAVFMLAIVLALAMALPAGATAFAAASDDEPTSSTRLYGTTAVDTSVKISRTAFPDGVGSKYAIIARSDDFADAMSATGLAGTLDCPIVTTDPDTPSSAMLTEIRRLGVDDVYIIGGTAAIDESIEEALEKRGVSVERIWGSNSWDTSVACAKKIVEMGGNKSGDVIVSTSLNFQDALSMSSFAYKYKVPIILETADYALTSGAKRIVSEATGKVFVAGGRLAVPTSCAENLVGEANVVRIAGRTGYDTSNQIATYMVRHGYLSPTSVYVATGAIASRGVDALSGAVLAGQNNAPILLVCAGGGESKDMTTIDAGKDSEGTTSYMTVHANMIKYSFIFGGSAVIPKTVKDCIDEIVYEDSKPASSSSSSSASSSSSSSISSTVIPTEETDDGFEYAVGDFYDGHDVRTGTYYAFWGKVGGSAYYTNSGGGVGFDCGKGVYITGYTGTSDKVEIPDTIDDLPVVCYAEDYGATSPASLDFSACKSLRAIRVQGNQEDASKSTITLGENNTVIDVLLASQSTIENSNLTFLNKLAYLEVRKDIPSIDYSELVNLRVVGYEGSNLDLKGNSSLQYLSISSLPDSSGFEELNVSGCANLREVDVYSSSLTDLKVSGCSKLQYLYVSGCSSLKSLDVAGLAALQNINVRNSGITSKDSIQGLSETTNVFGLPEPDSGDSGEDS